MLKFLEVSISGIGFLYITQNAFSLYKNYILLLCVLSVAFYGITLRQISISPLVLWLHLPISSPYMSSKLIRWPAPDSPSFLPASWKTQNFSEISSVISYASTRALARHILSLLS